jgi:hypothetical protein
MEQRMMASVDRWYASFVSIALLAAVLYPAIMSPADDGFPLSTYPMFARERPQIMPVNAALALDGAGSATPIPPLLIGRGETMQALRTLNRSVREGGEAARRLCHEIAARIATSRDREFLGAKKVALVTEDVDPLAYAAGERTPGRRRTRIACDVRRGDR